MLIISAGCNKNSTPSTHPPGGPTIASLVPSATDLIIGMGAKDRLVAVSTYDAARADVGTLPKAGDYDTVNWELLATLRPTVLCTAISPDRQPQGFKDTAKSLNIEVIDEKIDRLIDIDTAIDRLAGALNILQLGNMAKMRMHAGLDAVHQRVATEPPVTALIFVDSDAKSVAGPNNYLNDMLHLAGGIDAAESLRPYADIDHETLLKLNPQVIIQLLTNDSPQEKQKASDIWKHLPQLQAVAAGRVYPIYDEYALQPGWHVTELTEKFAECLHPRKTSPSSDTAATLPAHP